MTLTAAETLIGARWPQPSQPEHPALNQCEAAKGK
jgi:hypothetical protein